MDLSNLSSDLPPTKPINQESVNELNQELATEFKNAAKSVAVLYNSASGSKPQEDFTNAAKSVAALYRLTKNSGSLLLQKGYLECLDDILAVMANGEDMENWILAKRAEITNVHQEDKDRDVKDDRDANGKDNDTRDTIPDSQIPQGDFTFSVGGPDLHFVPSYPPMSVTHSKKQLQNFKSMKNLRRRMYTISLDETSDSDKLERSSSDGEVSVQEKVESMKKRRKKS